MLKSLMLIAVSAGALWAHRSTQDAPGSPSPPESVSVLRIEALVPLSSPCDRVEDVIAHDGVKSYSCDTTTHS